MPVNRRIGFERRAHIRPTEGELPVDDEPPDVNLAPPIALLALVAISECSETYVGWPPDFKGVGFSMRFTQRHVGKRVVEIKFGRRFGISPTVSTIETNTGYEKGT